MSGEMEMAGWLGTMEFVDIDGAVIRRARFFAYKKRSAPPFPARLHAECFEFVARAIRMNGELPEGLFLREKSFQISRVANPDQLDRLDTYYETVTWRCVRV
ncbi:MAG TPA: hypothetical protein VMS23_11245 [Terrimicrobiaceae bacterium]|nr:hypothetical protein [Terrimicrobiaceae bacterium]